MNDKNLSKVRYHLRFQIIPDKQVASKAQDLAEFCRKHSVEEVVLFFAAEEWNNGLLSKNEEDLWFETVKKTKEILETYGITVSLNPWATVLHCDRGRSFPKDRNIKPMVSPYGETSKACASFADQGWRNYIGSQYARFAKLGFRVIWIEDDFRYHNHSPLTWGGGFEPEIIHRFEEKIGKATTRKEIFQNILRPGEPHPWRTKWMETWREVRLEAASMLAKAVKDSSSGKTKIGLMSSSPSAHSIEGRRWHDTFKTLTINNAVAHRPNFAGYEESPGQYKVFSVMKLDMQKSFRPSYCEVAPEIENFPFTAWNKSDSLTWTEMALALFHGSDALLLDIFPFSGNSVKNEPNIDKLLDSSLPGLSWISERFSKYLNSEGVGIPWKQDAAEQVHTYTGNSMEELMIDTTATWKFLLGYGIPASAQKQQINALFGNSAWTFDEKQIQQFLSGGLLLDGASAQILCERGFGEYIGVTINNCVNRQDSTYSIEMVTSEKSSVPAGTYFNINNISELRIIEPEQNAVEWSQIITPDRKRFGSAIVTYSNKLGGRVVTYAAENPAQLPGSYQRQAILQNAVRFLSGDKPEFPLVTGGPYLIPMNFRGRKRNVLVILNGSPDPAEPVIQTNGVISADTKATLLSPLKTPVEIGIKSSSSNNKNIIASCQSIPYLGFLVVESQPER